MTSTAEKKFALLCSIDSYKKELDKPFSARPGSDSWSVNFQREMHNEMIVSMRARYHAACADLVEFELKKHRRSMATLHRRVEARAAQLPKAA